MQDEDEYLQEGCESCQLSLSVVVLSYAAKDECRDDRKEDSDDCYKPD